MTLVWSHDHVHYVYKRSKEQGDVGSLTLLDEGYVLSLYTSTTWECLEGNKFKFWAELKGWVAARRYICRVIHVTNDTN